MKIEKVKYSGVSADGKVASGGAVETAGKICMSAEKGGCGAPGCNCSPGHWISVFLPRTRGGIVEGIEVSFDSKDEMDEFMKFRQMLCKSKK